MDLFDEYPAILKFINSVAEQENIKNYTIKNVTTNAKGEGFLGQIFMITLDNTKGEELNIVVKAAFKSEKIRAAVPIRESFINEIYFYSTVNAAYKKLQKGISVNTYVPHCYKVCTTELEEMLCLENLKTANFEIFDKSQIVDDDHLSLIFKTYGEFHAYGFALKYQQPEEYLKITEKLHNIYKIFIDTPEAQFTVYLEMLSKGMQEIFIKGEDDELIEKCNKYSGSKIIDIFRNAITAETKYSTIVHGDCWSNNMLFKYQIDDQNKTPTEMRLIDLQLVKTGSPACDLSYVLYSGGTNKEFKNLDKYLKIYHTNLTFTLQKFGIDSKKVYPFEVLENDWKKFAKFGMIMGMMLISIKTGNPEDVKDLSDVFEAGEQEEIIFNDEYKKRASELLRHISEIDAL